jgi:S1-C subfamily serine protease
MILLVLALALLCALIGAAIALLVHPLRDGTDLSVRSSSARSGVNLPISSVEEVAAKVLPSVVTLQSEVGGQSYLGSGIVLTPGGVIMTNNHVVAAMAKAPRESVSALLTFNDGRTVAFSVAATDSKNDIATLMTPVFSKSALLDLVSPFQPTPLSALRMSSSRREGHRMVRWACKSTPTQALTAPGSSASVMVVPLQRAVYLMAR